MLAFVTSLLPMLLEYPANGRDIAMGGNWEKFQECYAAYSLMADNPTVRAG